MDELQFDQLPYLCMKRIFESLSLQDLVSCRAVNRHFKFYSDDAEIDELVVSGSRAPCKDGLKVCKHWYQTDRPIDFENSINLAAFSSVKSSCLKLDQHLKFLHIHLVCADINVEILNSFQQLVHLEVNCGARSDEPKTLSLANLKVFNVRAYNSNYKHNCYILDTPKLEILACEAIKRIRVDHPETVQQLVCDYRVDRRIGGDLKRFLLADWKGLKELQILASLNRFLERNIIADERLGRSLLDIMRKREALEREELKLYLGEVLLVDAEQLEFIGNYRNHFGQQWMLSVMREEHPFWFKYHRLLRHDSYPEVKAVDFSELKRLEVELSIDFFDRFPAIERLTATQRVDRDVFEWVLSNANALHELSLKNTLLGQAFMNRLPSLNRRLTSLKVDEDLVTNFNFILRFEQLKIFETTQQLPALFDLAAKAFLELKELSCFSFSAGNESVEIERSPTYNYILRCSTGRGQTFYQKNLKWPELAAYYQRKTSPNP